MRFILFDLERWQSTWENRVRFNLSESGVHPLSVQGLRGLAGASAVPLLDVHLGYSQSNGTDLVRERIGPVACFKQAAVVGKLPKTRSGKILRGTIRKIADGAQWTLPPTIEDPAALDEAAKVLTRLGYPRKAQ